MSEINEAIIIFGFLLLFLFVVILLLLAKLNKYIKLKSRLNRLDQYKSGLEKNRQSLFSEIKKLNDEQETWKKRLQKEKEDWKLELSQSEDEWDKKKNADISALDKLIKEKTIGFPWLADAYAKYLELCDLHEAKYLISKSHPAIKSAEKIKEIAAKRRHAEKTMRIFKFQLLYYENLFPWLTDFKNEDIDDLLINVNDKDKELDIDGDQIDSVKKWVSQGEYKNLSSIERNQLALDRYWKKKKKSKWEIGRDYERYIGYIYEKAGFDVYYQGIIEGFADLGRDLVAKKNRIVHIIQCKYWSKEKTIHEKHIFQLYGTVVAYKINHKSEPIQIKPLFYTTTQLSDKAKEFAKELEIEFEELFPFEKYPSIKCNVSRKTGEKIYHLPFDQKYDQVLIEMERNECYAETVKEAEERGFRRAFRWKGN